MIFLCMHLDAYISRLLVKVEFDYQDTAVFCLRSDFVDHFKMDMLINLVAITDLCVCVTIVSWL